MSSIIPFPMQGLDKALADDDQRQALRAMLRYLHRETRETGLPTTSAALLACHAGIGERVAGVTSGFSGRLHTKHGKSERAKAVPNKGVALALPPWLGEG